GCRTPPHPRTPWQWPAWPTPHRPTPAPPPQARTRPAGGLITPNRLDDARQTPSNRKPSALCSTPAPRTPHYAVPPLPTQPDHRHDVATVDSATNSRAADGFHALLS